MNTIQTSLGQKISFVATAFRPNNWMETYNNINQNDISFEMIFVGPNHPSYTLPDNFIFIQTDVKPVQCVEIAIRESSGDLVIIIADDINFVGDKPVEKLITQYNKLNSYKSILSCRMMEDNIPFDIKYHRFYLHDSYSPLMPIVGVMSKKLLNEIGSIDTRFIASMYDVDLSMRAIELGGKIVFSDVFVNEDKKIKSEGSNTASEFSVDRIFLDKLWTIDQKVVFSRNFPVSKFVDKDIRLFSQGPRGRWRGRNLKSIEYIIDVPIKKTLTFLRRIFSFHKYYYYVKKSLNKLYDSK